MPENVEVKATAPDLDALRERLAEITGTPPEILRQEDVFFGVKRGRLKLRCDEDSNCEVIYYRRADVPGPSVSWYSVESVTEPTVRREQLARMFGERSVVRKTREVFDLGDGRVAIDHVEGLGDYVEINVPVTGKIDRHRAAYIARTLLKRLHINEIDVVPVSYEDQLAPLGVSRGRR